MDELRDEIRTALEELDEDRQADLAEHAARLLEQQRAQD